jgi:hypothetical protein
MTWKEVVMAGMSFRPVICLKGLMKTSENHCKLAGVPAKIRIAHLKNKSQKIYRLS